ncbi:MAG TPA: MlaD family protein [Candidatus Acidoferrales bacterium]|jgi:phospholipid/cholesterol/gamma-HCH transport system substrate-binding protein|nr:MlaD family protein [Candidatus Acidoferrales bacterium]
MDSKREQALVGLFVLVASGLLITVVLLLSGWLTSGDVPFHAYFKNAGGLEPGFEVHYAGGPPVGRVTKVQSDPQDPTRMEVDFAVHPSVPVKTDSKAAITSNSPLGDNFLEIEPGSPAAPRAQSGSTLNSKDYTSLDEIKDTIASLGPKANELIDNLNQRVVALKETLDRVNDLLDERNRANISASLANLNGMLKEDRPEIHSTLTHVDDATAKLNPLIDDFRKTSAQADDAIKNLDAALAEDRPDLHASLETLRKTLNSAQSLTDQLDRTVNTNAENLDEILDNLRHITENMTEFTNTIKTRPYTLIRASTPKPHEPGEAPPK